MTERSARNLALVLGSNLAKDMRVGDIVKTSSNPDGDY